jgi:hypothetical protein
MIILEGPDAAGKTTLIQRLSGDLGVPIAQKLIGHDTQPLMDERSWVYASLEGGFKRQLYDRHWLISEPIYGPVLGRQFGKGLFDHESMQFLNQRLHGIQPITIWCLPDLATVIENLSGDKDNEVIFDHIEQIYESYWYEMARWPASNSRVWDYESSDAENNYDSICDFMNFYVGRR